MPKFLVQISARTAGAIGVFHERHALVVSADSQDEATMAAIKALAAKGREPGLASWVRALDEAAYDSGFSDAKAKRLHDSSHISQPFKVDYTTGYSDARNV